MSNGEGLLDLVFCQQALEDPTMGSTEQAMECLNSGYLQLGLFTLVSGALQVCWISTTQRKRDLARPLSEGEFRKSLERIWAKGS